MCTWAGLNLASYWGCRHFNLWGTKKRFNIFLVFFVFILFFLRSVTYAYRTIMALLTVAESWEQVNAHEQQAGKVSRVYTEGC